MGALVSTAKMVELGSMITGGQIRAARALLKWSGAELARKCGVSYPAIVRAEKADGIPRMITSNLMTIRNVLEAAGVEFFDGNYSGDGGPGVRKTNNDTD